MIENIQICYPFSMGKCPSNIAKIKLPRVSSSAYHSLNNNETQSDLTINISSLSRDLCRVDFDAMGNVLRDMYGKPF